MNRNRVIGSQRKNADAATPVLAPWRHGRRVQQAGQPLPPSSIGSEGIDRQRQRQQRAESQDAAEIRLRQIPARLDEPRAFQNDAHDGAGEQQTRLPAPKEQAASSKKGGVFMARVSGVGAFSFMTIPRVVPQSSRFRGREIFPARRATGRRPVSIRPAAR